MSLTKKVCIMAVCLAMALIIGCGSKEAPEKTTSETAVEQHSADDGHGHSAEKAETSTGELKPQTHCPVMGGEIDKSIFVEKDGKRIYMCCEHCREELTKNFEENVKKLAKMGQKPETI